jgi:hypothetical protein
MPNTVIADACVIGGSGTSAFSTLVVRLPGSEGEPSSSDFNAFRER